MRLSAGTGAVCTVEVGTRLNVPDCFVNVDEMQQAHQGQGVQGAVQEARVLLTPLVTSKSACRGILETGNVWTP